MSNSKLKQKFRQIKKLPDWVYFFPYILLQGCCKFLFRHKVVDPHNLIKNGRGFVTVSWHNRLLYFAPLFPKATREHTVAVVSASRDGQYVADLIARFGIKAMRGSSKKGGANAMLGAIRAMQDGNNVSFTPDGPRGPKYSMSKGPIHLASQAGTKIIPIGINASSYWEIKSWDNFQIPKPFATLTLVMGEPLEVPANMNEAEFEACRERVRQALLNITIDKEKKK